MGTRSQRSPTPKTQDTPGIKDAPHSPISLGHQRCFTRQTSGGGGGGVSILFGSVRFGSVWSCAVVSAPRTRPGGTPPVGGSIAMEDEDMPRMRLDGRFAHPVREVRGSASSRALRRGSRGRERRSTRDPREPSGRLKG